MKKLILLLLSTMLLGACGTTNSITVADLAKPIPNDKARIVVTRNTSLLYLAASATVKSNGAKIAGLGRGGSVIHDIPKGQNVLSVTTPASFGHFVVRFKAKEGKTYNFEVSPRGNQLLVGSSFGLLGDATHASISDSSGYFQLELKN